MSVALYAGEGISGLGFKVMPRDEIFGMCTSSSTVGPSISFGAADAATVVSSNVALADACATLLGNIVIAPTDDALSEAVTRVADIDGIEGALAAAGGRLAMKGSMPDLIKVPADRSKITRVELLPRT